MTQPLRIAVLLSARSPIGAGGPVLGRCERAALRTALALGSASDATLTAIAVGCDRACRGALAIARRAGCPRVVRVPLAADRPVAPSGIISILSAVLSRDPADIIVCGDRSDSDGSGAVGPGLADALDLDFVESVIEASWDPDGAVLVTQRQPGERLRYRCTLPAILGVRSLAPPATGGALPRREDDRDALVFTLSDLDLAEAAIYSSSLPSREPVAGARIESSARELLARLSELGALGH